MASTARAHWSNRLAFILAAAGSAVGLGNIWKFPYITGLNGGGAFVIVYLICIAVVGLPIFVAELFIGQRGQANAVRAFEVTHRPGTPWRAVGWLGLASAVLILSFYSVVGGWVLDFVFRSVTNQFAGKSDEEIRGVLGVLFHSAPRQLLFHGVFMALTVGIVAQGLSSGLERWNRILMPGLFIILLLLLGRAAFLPGFGDAAAFLFSPDASKLTAAGVLEAVGHSFFTLSLGMGAIIVYGSYLGSRQELLRTAVSVALLDTVVALAAGLVIFSIVFSQGLPADSGPKLMFQTLPMLLAKMPGGYLLTTGFFVLVAFAALTSAISLLEVAVSYVCETHNLSRRKTALFTGAAIYLMGVLSALSTNLLADVKVLGHTFFDLFDKLTSSIMLPLGGAVTAAFFGWVLSPAAAREVVGPRFERAAVGLIWLTRVVAPAAVVVILINGLRSW